MSDTAANPQQLAQQVMDAANSLSDEEASQRYQQILAQLPSDQAAELNTLAMSQVHATDRQQIASHFKQASNDPNSNFNAYNYSSDHEAASPANLGQMAAVAQQQDPGLLGGIFGNNSALGGQIGKAALAALAALLIRRIMSGQNSGYSQGGSTTGALGGLLGSILGGSSGSSYGSNDPLGGLLGSVLGGAMGGMSNSGYGNQQAPSGYGNQPSSSSYGNQSSTGGIDIGSILGGLLGGSTGGSTGNSGYNSPSVPPPSQSVPGGSDIGSILGGLLGGGGLASQASQGGGLGSILSSILGGGSSGTSEPSSAAPGAGTHVKEGIHLRNE